MVKSNTFAGEDAMVDRTPSRDKNLRKKLQKREQRILAQLQSAQQAQAKALERFHRAEARLQKRIARLERAEGRLTLVRQQLDELLASPPVEAQSIAPATADETRDAVGAQFIASSTSAETEATIGAQFIAPSPTDEIGDRVEPQSIAPPTAPVQEGRAAALAAEENARLMAGHAAGVASSQEQADLRHHLEQEVQQIKAEEEVVETITAVTIAEITAERAAAAKAFAEASSAHTREAHRRAEEAERALGEVRISIRNGLLTGEEAEIAMQRAEHRVTRAQAMLADAEADEEQALNAAINAEAEAEVAEGMAYATVNQNASLLEEEQRERERVEQEVSQTYLPQEAVEGEPDITLKFPHVNPQETE
jgi:hypothetical protein